MKIRDIIVCWDFILALIISVILLIILPMEIDMQLSKDIYQTAISVLSIIFSLYFAALAIIMASYEDGFVEFLEQDGIYTGIIDTFKFTLALTFISLIIALVLYIGTSYFISIKYNYQLKFITVPCTFFFIYSLFAVFNATLDSITYSKKRLEYIKKKLK